MGTSDVRNQPEIGAGDRAELFDLVPVVRSHFDHGEIGFWRHRQQCQRNPDVVVQVALRGDGAEPL